MRAVTIRIELRLPWSRSLKEKRAALRRFITDLDDLGSLSIAEVDHHDEWKLATIGVAVVAPHGPGMNAVLNQIRHYLGRPGDIEVTSFCVDDMETP